MGTSDGTLAHLFATYNMFYGVMHGLAYTLHENGVTLTQREPPVRISQPAAPITPRVHGPLDEWLVLALSTTLYKFNCRLRDPRHFHFVQLCIQIKPFLEAHAATDSQSVRKFSGCKHHASARARVSCDSTKHVRLYQASAYYTLIVLQHESSTQIIG